MPQNPLQTLSANPTQAKYNIAAAAVVKAAPGHAAKLIVQTAPSAGNLTINDNAATGGTNTIANQILSLAFGSLTAGQVIDLSNWPCKTGITISSVGTGGVYALSYT